MIACSSFSEIFGGRFRFLRSFLRDFPLGEESVFDGGSDTGSGFSSCGGMSSGLDSLLSVDGGREITCSGVVVERSAKTHKTDYN